MDPQTFTSDSSSLPDILPRLPKELFVLALDTLPLVDILNATAINKDYRDRIYSSPQLFSTIDETIYPEEVEGVSHPERANRATFKLIKCASLSNNRLKNVSLNLIPFEVDFFRADLSHWLSTSTYLLLQILRLTSSESLQWLSLKFRSSPPSWNGSRTSLTKVITFILRELRSFNRLNRIEIEGRTYLSILSSSATSKTNLSNPPKVLSIKSTVNQAGEIDSEWVHPDWDILREVQRFTGGGILEFKCHHSSNVPRKRVEDQVLQELKRSQGCLEILEIKDVMIQSPQEWLEFALACPKLRESGFNGTLPDGQSWKTHVIPISSPKITVLNLGVGPQSSVLTHPIIQVTANNLRSLQVSSESSGKMRSVNCHQLFHLVQLASSTVEDLYLSWLCSPVAIDNLKSRFNFKYLQCLRLFKVEIDICNFFLEMEWEDWTSLSMISIHSVSDDAGTQINLDNLFKRLCSVRTTLIGLRVEDNGVPSENAEFGLRKTQEAIRKEEKRAGDSVCFPLLELLQLRLEDGGLVRRFLSGNFPSLSLALLSEDLSHYYPILAANAPSLKR